MKQINLDQFRHQLDINLRYMDIDSMHHVNNARYLNYLEDARINYSQKVMGGLQNLDQLSVVVARIEIDYLAPIVFGDKIVVHSRISKIGQKSIHFESVIEAIAQEKKLAAQALQILVAVNPQTGKSREITPELRKKIESFEDS